MIYIVQLLLVLV